MWYKKTIEEIKEELKTDFEKGLNNDEVEKRLKEYGKNKLPEAEPINYFKIIIDQIKNPLIYILIAAFFLTIITGDIKDAIAIIVVVIINGVIGFVQEVKAEKSIRALGNMLVPFSNVIRNGRQISILSQDLVPGDVVILSSGDKVPADLRLFNIKELRIDESILTGESLPVFKTTDVINKDNVSVGDMINMAFMGSTVVGGKGYGVVVNTGERTVLGKIATSIHSVKSAKPPIQEKFEKFSKFIAAVSIVISIILFLIGTIYFKIPLKDMFLIVVATIVAAVPEGLPIVVTIALSIGINRMAKKNALIRKLNAVETLGSITAICSDKTGTLTKNEMTVKVIYDTLNTYEVSGTGYDPNGEIFCVSDKCESKTEKLKKLVYSFIMCNESSHYFEKGEWKIQGDPTEVSLIVCARKYGIDVEDFKSKNKLIDIIPFESEKGWMAVLCEIDGKRYIFVKGGVDRLLNMCVKNDYSQVLKLSEKFASDGMRILGFASKEINLEKLSDYNFTDLDFDGFVGMIDPPREEAIEAIEKCLISGIRVIMITGDHPLTALAIAKSLKIASDNSKVLRGVDIDQMSDDELYEALKDTNVFARVSPDNKLRIVKQVIRHGNIVAVTGDGVNDAAALKAAHVGVAMGKTGTDVTKETADMIVLDDNFASIYAAIVQGRVVYDNIRKATFFLIPTGVASILSISFSMFSGIPIPYMPIHLLWINLVTNGLQDISLAFEPGESDVEIRKPRNPKEPIMNSMLIQRTIIIGVLIAIGVIFAFKKALAAGYTIEHARTVAVTTMVFFQFFQCINSRSETKSIFRLNPLSNPFLGIAMLLALVAQLLFIYEPNMNKLFSTTALGEYDWLLILSISLSVIVVVEIDKKIRQYYKK